MFDRPTLPQQDSSPQDRAERLSRARATYGYAYSWPPGVAVAAEVPKGDTYSAMYVAHLLPVTWKLFENTIELGDLVMDPGAVRVLLEQEKKAAATRTGDDVGKWFLRVANALSTYVAAKKGVTVDAYSDLFAKLPTPPSADCWKSNETFAWERIAGSNPMMLTRVRALPDGVAVTEAHYARAIGQGDTLDAAIAEGRLYVCDYRFLEGVPTGTTDGRQKWLPAPVAVFARVGRDLRPVAVQVERTVFTPDDVSWSIAKLAVQVADANHHETVAHLGRTHLVMEAVTLSSRRQLSERHPLYVLLTPHCEFTLAINHSAATSLIAPGGIIDRVFGGAIEATAGLVKKGLDGWDLSLAQPPKDIAARGLEDLAEHPYRDDALLVYGAIHRFVDAYVRMYYATDADVAQDVEVAAWTREMGAEDGGRLRGVVIPTSIGDLVDLVASIVWTASGQHAAVNFTQYPYMSLIPNAAGAFWAAWDPTVPARESTHVDLLPPYDLALGQLYTLYQLSSLRVNQLGDYGLLHFVDGRAREAVSLFASELKTIDATIAQRDASRYLPYPYLRPSNIPASIHI